MNIESALEFKFIFILKSFNYRETHETNDWNICPEMYVAIKIDISLFEWPPIPM